jgi:TATA-binding protein-associated factor Taf7
MPSGDTIHEFCRIDGYEYAVYEFSQNAKTASEEGIHECELTLYSLGGEKITSPRFTLVVSDRVYPTDDNGGITEDDHGILDAIIINEQSRRASELNRENAETERIAAETVRAEAEDSRDAAEAERATADETRKAEYTKLEKSVSETVRKILTLQGRVIEIQNSLISLSEFQDELDAILERQNEYIRGE